MKKIELKVPIACIKCKTCVMKTVAKVGGIVKISVDAEKGLLTVIGDVDPCAIVNKLRKVKKCARIHQVSPFKEEEPKPPEKKEVPKEVPKEEPKPLPPCCNACQTIVIGPLTYDDPVWCSIL